MINMSVVNKAVFEILNSGLDDRKKYKVERAALVNTDSDRTPWVGIYRGTASYTPRSIASMKSGKQWRANPVVKLLVQAASGDSGLQCEERLEEYISDVMDLILSDLTLGGTVRSIIDFDVEYSFNEEVSKSLFFQMATIEITVESRT